MKSTSKYACINKAIQGFTGDMLLSENILGDASGNLPYLKELKRRPVSGILLVFAVIWLELTLTRLKHIDICRPYASFLSLPFCALNQLIVISLRCQVDDMNRISGYVHGHRTGPC